MARTDAHRAPTFGELFTPKLATVWREGYTLAKFQADAFAALTVAVVALPLSMAIAIASGAPPERGLITAIVGGFLISLLGGSRFQIGGPAGAFIVLVAATIERYGIDGLLLATFLAGFIQIGIGFLRLGAYVRYIPHPVIVGFTSGVAIIIFVSQIRDLFGLTLSGAEPAALLPKLRALWGATHVNLAAIAVSAASLAIIVSVRRWRPRWPAFLIAVAIAGIAAAVFSLPVETIASRFGGVPQTLPAPALPDLSWARIVQVLPSAFAIAALGCIESLLSAVVADGMTGRRHRSNSELVAQGVANIASAAFGGICATGTIARTATNIRSGAVGPVSGMLHSVFLLLALLAAAPLMGAIPLAALAAILAVVCWNMAEKHEFAAILRTSRGDAAVLLATFLIVVFYDLAAGIMVGVVMGSLLFMHRMAAHTTVAAADGPAPHAADEVHIHRLSGTLFFGAASALHAALERIGGQPQRHVLDLSGATFADHDAAMALGVFVDRVRRNGATVVIAGAAPAVRRALSHGGLRPPRVVYAASVAAAVADDQPPAA